MLAKMKDNHNPRIVGIENAIGTTASTQNEGVNKGGGYNAIVLFNKQIAGQHI